MARTTRLRHLATQRLGISYRFLACLGGQKKAEKQQEKRRAWLMIIEGDDMDSRRITDTICIVETREFDHSTYEVCATQSAEFDDASSLLAVKLGSFVRQVQHEGADTIIAPLWLPQPESVQHRVQAEEAVEDAREIFQRWVRKLRSAVPSADEFARSIKA